MESNMNGPDANPSQADSSEAEHADHSSEEQQGASESAGEEDGASQDEGEGAEGDEDLSAEPPPPEPTLWEIIRESYFTFDRRTLGLTRIFLGFLLITDLFRRGNAWVEMYSTEGVLPNHVNLFRPQSGALSLLNAFSTPGELWVLWGLMFATFFCLLIGYKTRVAQVLSLVWVTSMDVRILLIENGGYVVYNLLLLWTCFLPLGDRFSVDAMRASLRERREASEEELNDRADLVPPAKTAPYVSLIGLVILLQISAIYFFNVVHKTGPAWRNGTAVHYVLYVDRMVTPLVGMVREYIPPVFILGLTKFVMAAEAAIPVCALSPLGRVWARRLTIVLMNALHLGFGSVFVLGPFAWALCVFSTLLFSREDWEVAAMTMRRVHRARTVLYDPRSGMALLACRVWKRLDHFELLTFKASEGVTGGIAVEGPTGRVTRALAWADIVAALPLGPIVAWVPRLPGVRHAIDAAWGALEPRGVSRFFGLRVPASSYLAPETAPLRLKLRRALFVLHELAVAAMFAAAVNQAMVELWVVKNRIKVPQPEPLRSMAQKLRFLQGWFMFSPNPVMDDGTLVVDAVTVDGRHVDPFTGKEPNFDLLNAKSFGYNQIWSDYFNRMRLSQNSGFRDAMKEYMFRLPERTGRQEDTIVSGDVYWVQDMNPKWRDTKSYKFEKNKLFSFENPKAKPQASNP